MKQSILLTVSYNQIALFHSKLKNPFNDWTDKHVLQGFAWRNGSVSFATMEDGKHKVHIGIEDTLSINKNCIRAISVPFEIPKEENVELGSISETVQMEMPSGKYQLVFQIVKPKSKLEFDFTLIKDGDMEPAILKKDKSIKVSGQLLMKAKPA